MKPPLDRPPDQPLPGQPPPAVVAWYAEGSRDRLGDRLLLFDNVGANLELLRLNRELVAVDGFEAALRTRVDELKHFRHERFARVRAVKWLDDPRPQLALVSEHVPGERLSRVLDLARARGLRPGTDAVVWLLQQLLPALAALHEHKGLSHGLLSLDRIIVMPGGELAIADYALGSAIERQRLTPFELWQRYGVGATPEPGRTAFDPQADVQQLARVALSMLSGRLLRTHGIPETPEELLEQAHDHLAGPSEQPLRTWLARALGLEPPPFRTAREAQVALDSLLPRVEGTWSPWLLPGAVDPTDGALPATPSPALGPPGPVPGARSHETTRAAASAERAPVAPTAFDRWTEPVASKPPIEVQVRRLQLLAGGLAVVAIVEAVLLVAPGWIRHVPAAVPAAALSTPVATGGGATSTAGSPVQAAGIAGGTPQGTATPNAGASGAAGRSPAGEPTRPARSRTATAPLPPVSPGVIGWLAVKSDVAVTVYANGRLLGSGSVATYRLPAGEHEITLVNESDGAETTETVHIAKGQTVSISRLPTQ